MFSEIVIIKESASSLFRPRRFASPRAVGFFCFLSDRVMSHTPWQARDFSATVQRNAFRATADLTRPHDGLTNVVVAGQAFSAARLLGIVAAPTVVAAGVSPTEHYVRSTDLIVAYEEFEGPVRVDCLWRATEPATDDRFLAAIDLVISVRARTLDSHPELAVASVVPASEALRLQGVEPDGWKPQRVPTGAPLAIMPDDGPGCLLFRLPGAELSYAEMVHPADFRYDEVARDESGGDLAHRPSVVSNAFGKGSDPSRPGAWHFSAPRRRHGDCRPVLRRLCRRGPAAGRLRRSTAALGCAGAGLFVAVHSRGRLCYKDSHDRRLHHREFPVTE